MKRPRIRLIACDGCRHADAAVGIGDADDGVIIRRRGARLEGFEDGAAVSPGPARMPVLASTRISLMPAGTLNGIGGLVGERKLEEVARDRRGQMAAGGGIAPAERRAACRSRCRCRPRCRARSR